MTIPKAPKFSSPKKGHAVPLPYQEQTASMPPEILVVEDGSGIFPQIGAILQDEGFQVILAPDADTALQEMSNYDVAAVIAGASRKQNAGLHVLAAVKEKRTGVKTMVVTRLINPELPLQAYEMDIDDYIHWPLSNAELTSRLKGLLKLDGAESTEGFPRLENDTPDAHTFAALDTLVDRFTDSLEIISQTLEDVRQEHLPDMGESLSEELFFIAAQVKNLSDTMRHCWCFGTAKPASRMKPQRFH